MKSVQVYEGDGFDRAHVKNSIQVAVDIISFIDSGLSFLNVDKAIVSAGLANGLYGYNLESRVTWLDGVLWGDHNRALLVIESIIYAESKTHIQQTRALFHTAAKIMEDWLEERGERSCG